MTDHEFHHNIVKVAVDYFDNVMTKFIVNNKTDAHEKLTSITFTTTNSSHKLHRLEHIDYKFVHLSAYQ